MSGHALPQRQKPKVCGKFKTYRAHRDAATPLPAVSLREKGGVLMGSGICRILPTGGSGSAGKNRDRPTRPRFYASATCGFVTENLVVLGGFRFFPALPENAALHRELKRQSQHPRQHPVVAETSKGRCRKTEQRPLFVIASRRVRDDSITENILP